ncbi:MAG: hypothetical protein QMC36_01510 [Patescibacteria group bacterium]
MFVGLSIVWSVTATPGEGVQLFAETCPVASVQAASRPSPATVAQDEKSNR